MSWDYSLEFIRRRYERIAPIYRLFEVAFLLPPGIRRNAVERLALRPGDRVVEIGCGTGRNLAHLVEAVGPQGEVIGVDATLGMIDRARRLSQRRGWDNVVLQHQDAQLLNLDEGADGVLFSLSYGVLPNPRAVLSKAWGALNPGGRLVIMDAGLPGNALGGALMPVTRLLSRATVLGNPDIRPGDDLAELCGGVITERFQLSTYYIYSAVRSVQA